jgi:hypothetical protein
MHYINTNVLCQTANGAYHIIKEVFHISGRGMKTLEYIEYGDQE